MGAQLGGAGAYPYVHVWMEPIHAKACSHGLHLHLLVFLWFRASLWGSPRGLHITNHCAYRSYGDAFEHPFNVVSCTSIRWCWPHSCGSYVGRLQNWISSCSEKQIWLEKLPNQICSRPVECNASCLIVCIGLGNTFSWVNSGASHGFNELQ